MDFLKENWIRVLITVVVLFVLYKCFVERFAPIGPDGPNMSRGGSRKCLVNCNVKYGANGCDPSKGELEITPENMARCNSG